VLLVRSRMRRQGRLKTRRVAAHLAGDSTFDVPPLLRQRLAFAGVLVFAWTIPSNWTQDVPARYGTRHAGLEHSLLYPQIDTAPRPGDVGRRSNAPALAVGACTSPGGVEPAPRPTAQGSFAIVRPAAQPC
jgi:hypothetical protein